MSAFHDYVMSTEIAKIDSFIAAQQYKKRKLDASILDVKNEIQALKVRRYKLVTAEANRLPSCPAKSDGWHTAATSSYGVNEAVTHACICGATLAVDRSFEGAPMWRANEIKRDHMADLL